MHSYLRIRIYLYIFIFFKVEIDYSKYPSVNDTILKPDLDSKIGQYLHVD